MSKSITIRNVPDATVNELAARAGREGRSLQEYLKAHLVDLTSKPDINSWLARVQDRLAANPTDVTTEDIIAWRDADRP